MKIVARKEIEISEKRLARKFYREFCKFYREHPGYHDDMMEAYRYFCAMDLCGFAEAAVDQVLGDMVCDYSDVNELANMIEDRCEDIILKEGVIL